MSGQNPSDPNPKGPAEGDSRTRETPTMVRFDCQGCGQEMTFNPAKGQLHCTTCGRDQTIELEDSDIKEQDLVKALAEGESEEGYGLSTHTLTCKNCGATVSFPEGQTNTECAFCGSAYLAEPSTSKNAIRPKSLLPFVVTKARATSLFREWLGKGWFRPSNLKKLARVDKLKGLYCPFWTFDAQAASSWQAEAGYYYYITETYTTQVNGRTVTRTRQRRRTRWERAQGSRRDFFDDLLIPASQMERSHLIQEVYPFDLTDLTAYQSDFLAGWQVLVPEVNLSQSHVLADQSMRSTQKSRCHGDVPGDTQRYLQVDTSLSAWTFKHTLLPLWMAAFRYGGKTYPFVINGQSGKIHGKKPYSWVKITLAVLGGLAIAGIIGLVIYLKK